MDGDVMHGCSVALEQGVKVSPTVSERIQKYSQSSLGFEVEILYGISTFLNH